jgi:uncharacterized protein YndB with AHSA1/START domain
MSAPIRREVIVDASLEDVWVALTTRERVGAWFGAEVELEARPDGPISVRFADGSVRRGVVETVEAPDRFAFRWRSVGNLDEGASVGDGSTVEFRLSRTDDGRTRIVVTENPLTEGSTGAPAGPLARTDFAVLAGAGAGAGRR